MSHGDGVAGCCVYVFQYITSVQFHCVQLPVSEERARTGLSLHRFAMPALLLRLDRNWLAFSVSYPLSQHATAALVYSPSPYSLFETVSVAVTHSTTVRRALYMCMFHFTDCRCWSVQSCLPYAWDYIHDGLWYRVSVSANPAESFICDGLFILHICLLTQKVLMFVILYMNTC